MACILNYYLLYINCNKTICNRRLIMSTVNRTIDTILFPQDAHHIAVSRKLANTSVPAETLDNFAERIVQEKIAKWDSIKLGLKKGSWTKEEYLLSQQNILCKLGTRNMDKDQESELDTIIKKFVERDDILPVLQKCIEYRCCPSSNILLELASKFARLGERQGIDAIQTICKDGNALEYLNQAGYKHYMAEATWIRGNIEIALELFLDVYKNNQSLRKKVRSMVKFLFEDVVTQRGEAQLVIITKFAKMMASNYDDLIFMAFLWQFCFMSEWFSDQKVAIDLLDNFPGLSSVIVDRIPIVTMTSLREHKVENIQRLLEILLKYDMRQQYAQLLRVFFDYKCNQGDLQSCSAIIQSSLELDVALTANQHTKFLSLLLDRQKQSKWLSRPKQRLHKLQQPPAVAEFQFKF